MSAPQPTVATTCYFDMSIKGEPAGRITFELFGETPKTSENFKQLCAGTQVNGKPAGYAGSIFHRCIPEFMLQGGDFTNFNGTGGVSIYGEKFADENFIFRHETPFLLSMANAGPNTNGSQFFITTVPTPWLDGKHVVFGRVADDSSKEVVKNIEGLKTGRGDKPIDEVKVEASGVL